MANKNVEIDEECTRWLEQASKSHLLASKCRLFENEISDQLLCDNEVIDDQWIAELDHEFNVFESSSRYMDVSFGVRMLEILNNVPHKIGRWNQDNDKFCIDDWIGFLDFCCQSPAFRDSGKHSAFQTVSKKAATASTTSCEQLVTIFRTSGIALEMDLSLTEDGTEVVTHYIKHPLLEKGNYEKAKRFGWFGPVATPAQCRFISNTVIRDLFPEIACPSLTRLFSSLG